MCSSSSGLSVDLPCNSPQSWSLSRVRGRVLSKKEVSCCLVSLLKLTSRRFGELFYSQGVLTRGLQVVGRYYRHRLVLTGVLGTSFLTSSLSLS